MPVWAAAIKKRMPDCIRSRPFLARKAHDRCQGFQAPGACCIGFSPGRANETHAMPYGRASGIQGGVAFGGAMGIDNLEIAYDTQRDRCRSVKADDDAGDDLVVNETFTSTSLTVTHDDAGNFVDDGVFVYQYNAWNRLVLVRSSTDAEITIQTAEFDVKGRWIKRQYPIVVIWTAPLYTSMKA